ncbi:hypothetical protein [Novosphingobium sp. TH158]|uniref:hypothetical protein n=1 Tax=Novosphingobium sp. TH158 TaxID=2067455 RepID=UPI000C7BCA86|nr:hypothetical protein [Novosphingobium sp. TH158]PLK24361.1 hypothetical protein C0V78_13965 [Novosphingobium sp. TH158]
MNQAFAIFALVALGPAAFSTGPAAASAGLVVPICAGANSQRTIELPIPGGPARSQESPCCAKGCHSSGSRKKPMRQFDPTQ